MRPLGAVAEIIRGVTFDKSQVSSSGDEGLIPILRAGNIQRELHTADDLVYVPRSLVSDPQLMRSGDMAICMSSGSSTIVGKSARLDYDWHGSVGAFCAIVRFNTALDSRYGSYWFKSDSFKTWRNANAKGANIQNLRRTDLERIRIPVPPLAEQERIVRLLDEADAIRKLRAQADQRTADLIPALFHDMFGDPVTNPMGWPKRSLLECANRIVDCPHSTPTWTETGVVCIRTPNLGYGDWNWTDQRFVSESEFRLRTKRSEIVSGDIILSREGTVGVASMVPPGLRICMGQRLVQVRPDHSLLTSEFLLHVLLNELAPDNVEREMAGSTSRHFNVGQLKQLQVILPPLGLQETFSTRVAAIRTLRTTKARSTVTSQAAFDALLTNAFN